MALPAGVNLATVTTGVFSTLESGSNLAVTITATASASDIVWSTDGISGTPYLSQPFSNHANVGEQVAMSLLPTDLESWYYDGTPVDVSNGNQAFVWTITAQAFTEDPQGRDQPLGAPITWANVILANNGGNPGTFDLDMMVTGTFEGNTLVTIPFPAWIQGIQDAVNNAANSAANYAANSANSAGAASNAETGAIEANTAAQAAATSAARANSDAWNAANGVGNNLDPVLANVILSANSNSYAAVFGGQDVTFTFYGNGLIDTVHEAQVGEAQNRDTAITYFDNGLINTVVEAVTDHDTATSTFTWDGSGNLIEINRTVA